MDRDPVFDHALLMKLIEEWNLPLKEESLSDHFPVAATYLFPQTHAAGNVPPGSGPGEKEISLLGVGMPGGTLQARSTGL